MWKKALSTRRRPYSRELLRDCEIFANLRLTFVCSSSGGGVINGEKMVSAAGGWKWLEVAGGG